LNVPARLALRLDDVVRLLDQVLEEHLGSDGDYEGGVVAAAVDIVVL
jgi:cephalosporin-C deacetylase-like acetyl esterase